MEFASEDPRHAPCEDGSVQPVEALGKAVPKRRGRPEKPKRQPTPCTRGFDDVAAEVAELGAGPRWRDAKERLRSDADRNAALSPAAVRVLGFLLVHINRRRGYDWHAAETIASDRGLGLRSVERAFRQLIDAGLIIRRCEVAKGSRASKRWATTIPGLVTAAEGLRNGAEDPPGKCGRTRQKTGEDPTEKAEGPANFVAEGPANFVGQTLEENTNLGNNPPPLTPPPLGKAGVGDLDLIFSSIDNPDRRRVIAHLLGPVLRQRRFEAPDPGYALGAIADAAHEHGDEVLDAAARRLLAERASVVKASDLERAIGKEAELERARNAATRLWDGRAIAWKGTPKHDAYMAALARDKPFDAELMRDHDFVVLQP